MDTHSYTECLTILRSLAPDEILLHDGTRGRILSTKILEIAPTISSSSSSFEHKTTTLTSVLFISRHYFDQDRGAELLRNLICGEVDADLISKYTVLAGKYI